MMWYIEWSCFDLTVGCFAHVSLRLVSRLLANCNVFVTHTPLMLYDRRKDQTWLCQRLLATLYCVYRTDLTQYAMCWHFSARSWQVILCNGSTSMESVSLMRRCYESWRVRDKSKQIKSNFIYLVIDTLTLFFLFLICTFLQLQHADTGRRMV